MTPTNPILSKSSSRKQSPLSRSTGSRFLIGAATLAFAAGLLSLSASPAFADDAMTKSEKEKYEPGHKFEYAHPPKDSAEAKERREAEMRWRHDHPMGNAGAKNGHGPKGKKTHVNSKMKGHTHHEDHPMRSDEDAKKWQDNRMWRQTGTWQGGKDWNNARSKNWQRDHSTWPQRGSYGGAFITQPEYDKHYTVAHDFRIGDEPKMIDGYAHFKHEGDEFVIVDPYPENWNTKWHSSDDVYLDYNQGYYLHNRQHTGSPLAVMVLK